MPNGGQASGMALVLTQNTDYVLVCNFLDFNCKIVNKDDWERDKLDATPLVSLTEDELRLLAWFVSIWRNVDDCSYRMPGVRAEFWIG